MKTEFSSSIFYSVEVEGNSLVLSVSLGDKTRQARVDFLSPVEAVSVAYFLEMNHCAITWLLLTFDHVESEP